MSEHRNPDGTGSADPDLDSAASDALEARLSARSEPASDPRVDALAIRMQTVRNTLSEDIDGPSDAQMEEMLQKALRSAAAAGSDVGDRATEGHAAVVPVPNRHGHRRTRDRVIAAAAALAVVVAGVAVISYSIRTPTDVASPAADEADTTDSGSGEREATPPSAPGALEDRATVLEDADSGAAAPPSGVQAEESFQAADRIEVLAGLEFTIVVRIAGP